MLIAAQEPISENEQLNIAPLNFNKMGGLIPVCIQDFNTMQVLMQACMNIEALEKTIETNLVTFYSRTKKRLWVKGETSKNYLKVVKIIPDCDNDSLLIYVNPVGPTCHTGDASCYKAPNESQPSLYWLSYLKKIIQNRKENPIENSYTNQLLNGDIKRIAQKVGEEGVEVALAAVDSKNDNLEFTGEVVDLLYHLFVLLTAKGVTMEQVAKIIQQRNNN